MSPLPEHRVEFTSFDEWSRWVDDHPEVLDRANSRSIVEFGRRHGVRSEFLGKIPPSEIEVRGSNYREAYMARGQNPRRRAVLDLLAELPVAKNAYQARIYAPEALTPFALLLRSHFPRFI